jgi:tRNA-Thr(GGU) m(6)t(6)A37 methyltransferase TsaA
MALKPIGTVSNDVKDPGMHDSQEIVSEIVCDPGFNDALDGIEEFSHIMVIFWMHRSPAWEHSQSKIHPQRREDLPLVGVFATHSPFRPNRLGVTIVRLLERRDSVLKVVGLDAIDGTPVVDIKPHFPEAKTAEIRVPDWVHQLRQFASRRQS